jgi:hypothetical protein
MKVRNKRNGTNTLAYKLGGVTKSEIIPAGSVVDLFDLNDFNQIVNKHDFNRGWFEILKEENKSELVADSILEKAKKEAEEYSEEDVKTVKTKNK